MKRFILAAMLATGLAGAAHADDALKAAIASSERTPANATRDAARHPYETLTFFGIKPNMTVIEIAPGGGWYTEILGPYLRDKGTLVVAGSSPTSANENARKGAENFGKWLAAKPAQFGKVKRATFEQGSIDLGTAASADMVLTFRNVHNWGADEKVAEVFKHAYNVLKKGGVLGVVDHRLPASAPAKPQSGYVHEARVIKLAESVGFKLAAKSEVNANPKDTADYEKGVWSLPPVLANKDVERAKYVAIGESDRMTLKFVKP